MVHITIFGIKNSERKVALRKFSEHLDGKMGHFVAREWGTPVIKWPPHVIAIIDDIDDADAIRQLIEGTLKDLGISKYNLQVEGLYVYSACSHLGV